MKSFYLKFLSLCYLVGAVIHLLDVFSVTRDYVNLALVDQIWIVYLLIFDSIAAVGLWKQKKYGEVVFLIIAFSQLIAYVGFQDVFGKESFLISFHVITVSIYLVLDRLHRYKNS